MKKLGVFIPIFLMFVLAFSIIGNVSAQPAAGDYIVAEYDSGLLSKVTPSGTMTLITSGLIFPWGVAIVPETNPVGGIYAPTEKLIILIPYIALVGLIGAVSTIFAIRRWRKD